MPPGFSPHDGRAGQLDAAPCDRVRVAERPRDLRLRVGLRGLRPSRRPPLDRLSAAACGSGLAPGSPTLVIAVRLVVPDLRVDLERAVLCAEAAELVVQLLDDGRILIALLLWYSLPAYRWRMSSVMRTAPSSNERMNRAMYDASFAIDANP